MRRNEGKRKMKTIVFYGSPLKQSHTKDLLDEMLSVLEGEVRMVDCYRTDIAPCKDCKYCFHEKGCSVQDEMQSIYRDIEECDAVIIATPMHFGIMSAPMFTLFSRLQSYWSARHIRRETDRPKEKYGALLVTTGGNWVNMELLMEGVCFFAFDHMEADCIGSVYAKETDMHPVKDNEKAKMKARNLAYRLNALCANTDGGK